MHKEHPVLIRGSLKFLLGDYNCLVYGRFSEEEQIVVVFNNNDTEKTLTVNVWPVNVGMNQPMTRILYTDADGFSEEPEYFTVQSGELHLTLPRTSAVVLRTSEPGEVMAKDAVYQEEIAPEQCGTEEGLPEKDRAEETPEKE